MFGRVLFIFGNIFTAKKHSIKGPNFTVLNLITHKFERKGNNAMINRSIVKGKERGTKEEEREKRKGAQLIHRSIVKENG